MYIKKTDESRISGGYPSDGKNFWPRLRQNERKVRMRPTHFIGLRRDFKKIIKLIKKKVMTSSMKTDLKFSSQIQMHSVFLKSNHKKIRLFVFVHYFFH